jgi:hypothetical protein
LIESISEILAKGMEVGDFRSNLDPRNAARAFIAYQQGLARLWLSNTKVFSIKEEAGKLTDIYMRGILA